MIATADYSPLDRFVHRVAFAGTGLQKVLAEIEDGIFQDRLSGITCKDPVFITSLPRAGTTLLLDILASLPVFATHTYRQMPFLLCPLLWDRLTSGFRRAGTSRERAHGDGMRIDFDSPEAFEEAVWRAWWPEKYEGGAIARWGAADRDDEFETFLARHMRKIIALGRKNASPHARRYVSKNNANIARLPLLAALYPECRIVVPVREPAAHAVSLHRQHLRFLDMHAEDRFASFYMRAIGHFDFGQDLQPVNFGPKYGGPRDAGGAQEPGYWLDYWNAAYSTLRATDVENVILVRYEGLCEEPAATLERMLTRLGEPFGPEARAASCTIRTPMTPSHETSGLDPVRLAKARAIYDALCARAI